MDKDKKKKLEQAKAKKFKQFKGGSLILKDADKEEEGDEDDPFFIVSYMGIAGAGKTLCKAIKDFEKEGLEMRERISQMEVGQLSKWLAELKQKEEPKLMPNGNIIK